MKTILKLYAFFRSLLSPIVWRIFYWKNRRSTVEGVTRWMMFLEGDMEEASRVINTMPYKADRGKGFVDASIPTKHCHSFFNEIKHGRDCDDWARLWSVWGWLEGWESREWIVTERRHPFKRAHMVTTLSKDKEHWLMDYRPYGPRSSVETALENLGLKYDEPIIVEYKWRREW